MSHVSSVNELSGNLTAADVFASVPSGSNQRMGTATLVAGTATVNNSLVTDDSVILLTDQDGGGTEGFLVVSARTAGTSFTITSSSNTHTGKVGWLILEPAA
jgi:hypothetical protein